MLLWSANKVGYLSGVHIIVLPLGKHETYLVAVHSHPTKHNKLWRALLRTSFPLAPRSNIVQSVCLLDCCEPGASDSELVGLDVSSGGAVAPDPLE